MDNYEDELNNREEEQRSSSVDFDQVKDSIDKFREKVNPKTENVQSGVGHTGSSSTVSPGSSAALESSAGQTMTSGVSATTAVESGAATGTAGTSAAGTGAATGTASTSAAGASAATGAAGTTTATAGTTAAAGTTTAAAGTTTAAATTAGGMSLLWWVVIIVVIILLIIIMIFMIFSIVDSMSMRYGVSEEELVNNEKYMNNEINIDELNASLMSYDCETDFWEDLEQFFTHDAFTSFCSVNRNLNKKISELESKYDFTLSPGHVISTILYAYYNQPKDTENRIDESSPTKILEALAEARFIKKDDITTMIDNMYISYNTYSWTVSNTTEASEEGGTAIKKWSCVTNDEQAKFDMDKFLIFLRYGADKAQKYEDSKKYSYAKMGSDRCCTSEEITCSIPNDTTEMDHEYEDNYRGGSIEYFKNSTTNLEYIDRYLQHADSESLTKDEILPIMFDGSEQNLDYKEGFVYIKFPGFRAEAYDETYTPKTIEKIINSIETHGDTINQILGKDVLLGEGFYGGDIAEVAIAMYENKHAIYGNSNICYVSPDDYYRPAAYKGEKNYQGQYFGTDCNGFVGLVLHEATGIGPEDEAANTGGDVTFFSPHAITLSNGRYAAGPRSAWNSYFVKVAIDITSEEAYELMQIGEILPGDIIYYAQPDGSNSSNHVIIYVGNTDKGNHMIVDNTGPSDSCGDGHALNYEPFPESRHYNDSGVRVAVYRYNNISNYEYNGTLPGNYTFGRADINVCDLNNYKIRLVNCTSGSAIGYNWNNTMPGGYQEQEINGRMRKVAKETIDVERYIKGLITSEINSGYPIEAIKMQMIMAKTYMFNAVGSRVGVNGDELLVQTGDCFQVYHDIKYRNGYLNGSAENKATVDEAYNIIKSILIMRDNNIISAQYGSVLQNKLRVAANNGATFIDMFETFMQDYSKGHGYIYRGATLSSCYY